LGPARTFIGTEGSGVKRLAAVLTRPEISPKEFEERVYGRGKTFDAVGKFIFQEGVATYAGTKFLQLGQIGLLRGAEAVSPGSAGVKYLGVDKSKEIVKSVKAKKPSKFRKDVYPPKAHVKKSTELSRDISIKKVDLESIMKRKALGEKIQAGIGSKIGVRAESVEGLKTRFTTVVKGGVGKRIGQSKTEREFMDKLLKETSLIYEDSIKYSKIQAGMSSKIGVRAKGIDILKTDSITKFKGGVGKRIGQSKSERNFVDQMLGGLSRSHEATLKSQKLGVVKDFTKDVGVTSTGSSTGQRLQLLTKLKTEKVISKVQMPDVLQETKQLSKQGVFSKVEQIYSTKTIHDSQFSSLSRLFSQQRYSIVPQSKTKTTLQYKQVYVTKTKTKPRVREKLILRVLSKEKTISKVIPKKLTLVKSKVRQKAIVKQKTRIKETARVKQKAIPVVLPKEIIRPKKQITKKITKKEEPRTRPKPTPGKVPFSMPSLGGGGVSSTRFRGRSQIIKYNPIKSGQEALKLFTTVKNRRKGK
jgi:hypothetical protein